MPEKPDFIKNREQLERACQRWVGLDALALDTEFERTRTYYSRPALVQVFDGESVTLIDPLGIDDFSPLGELLRHPPLTKVMHAAEADIEVFEQLAGVLPDPVFDTQIAAAFAGHGYSLGYRKLAQILLGEELAKAETRSDWLRRPLSDAQIAYAALDVVHLLPMYRLLRDALVELGRDEWLREEIRYVQRRRDADRDPRRAYQRIRSRGYLDARGRSALRELAAWRELEARDRDVPRQTVIDDPSLLALASALPADEKALTAIPELSATVRSQHASTLVHVLARSRTVPAEAAPAIEVALDRRYAPQLKALKEIVRERAGALGMPAPLLAQSRALESLVQSAVAGETILPEALQGWRHAVIGKPLLRALEAMDGDS